MLSSRQRTPWRSSLSVACHVCIYVTSSLSFRLLLALSYMLYFRPSVPESKSIASLLFRALHHCLSQHALLQRLLACTETLLRYALLTLSDLACFSLSSSSLFDRYQPRMAHSSLVFTLSVLGSSVPSLRSVGAVLLSQSALLNFASLVFHCLPSLSLILSCSHALPCGSALSLSQ